MSEMGALEGVRVVDAGLLVQGPQAALMLADFGADVIKVELPGFGDQARWIPLSANDLRTPYYEACNRGKRSVTIDLRVPEGREAFLDLVDTADVVISNFKPGTLDDWGLGYDVVAERNPRVVYATGSTFGPEGPDATLEGADLAGQAAGGLISTTGIDGGPLTPVGVTIADHTASQNMVAGILAALLARERTGQGQQVDVSLLGGQVYAQASEYTAFLMTGQVPGRANRGHPLLPMAYGILPTADGYLALVGVLPDRREAFYSAVGCPELAEDPRFQGMMFTTEARLELFELLAEYFPRATTDQWVERLRAIGVRCAPVDDYARASENPQVTINGYLPEVDHPGGGLAHPAVRHPSTTVGRSPRVGPAHGGGPSRVGLRLGPHRCPPGSRRHLSAPGRRWAIICPCPPSVPTREDRPSPGSSPSATWPSSLSCGPTAGHIPPRSASPGIRPQGWPG